MRAEIGASFQNQIDQLAAKNKNLEQANSELESQIEVLQVNGLSQQFVDKLETKINETAPLVELETRRKAILELEERLKNVISEKDHINNENTELKAARTNLT